MEKLDLRPRGDSGFYSPPGADTAIYPSHVQPYEFVRRPLLNRRSCRFDGGGGACVCVYTQLTTLLQRLLWLVFAHPSHPDELGTGPFYRIPTLTTMADSPTEFRAHRRSLTDPAPARRGASVDFFHVYLAAPDLVNGGESPEFSGSFPESFLVHSGSSAGGILIEPEFSPRILRTQQAFSDPEFLPAALRNSD